MNKSKYDWSEIIPQLGKKTDKELSIQFGINHRTIAHKRKKLGIPVIKRNAEIVMLLGSKTDAEIAKMFGLCPNSITVLRRRHNIKTFGYDNREEKSIYLFSKDMDNFVIQAPCRVGRVDLLTDDAIYEFKIKLTTPAMYHAVGQLFLYSMDYPNRRKVVVCRNNLLTETAQSCFEELGIEIVTFDY